MRLSVSVANLIDGIKYTDECTDECTFQARCAVHRHSRDKNALYSVRPTISRYAFLITHNVHDARVLSVARHVHMIV